MSGSRRKQVLGVPTPFKGEFSFVNKDASNIAKNDHAAAVSWHVVNRFEKWKKVEEAKKLRRSAKIPSIRSSGPATMDSEQDTSAYPPEPWHASNAEKMMFGSQDISFSDATASNISTPASVSDSTGPGTETLDCAHLIRHSHGSSTALQDLPPLVSRIISFAYGIMIPLTWPNDSGKEKWNYEISRMWDDISAINNDACYGFASLCLYATLMASATNDSDLVSQACFFQAQAMTELQQRISSEAGNHRLYTLKAILRLFSAETALYNTAKARIHLKMLRSLIVAGGGVNVLDQWFKEDLITADCFFALRFDTRPLFPIREWTPGPMLQFWKARFATLKMQDGHDAKVSAIVENATLREIIVDLREMFLVESVLDLNDNVADDQFMRWRRMRKLDCINRLAELQLSLKLYPHLYVLSKLQLAICKTVALMTAMVLGSPEPMIFGAKLLRELRPLLEAAKQEVDQEGNDVEQMEARAAFFWILYVGSLAETVHGAYDDGEWFTQEYGSWTDESGPIDDDAQAQVLRKFLFSRTLVQEVRKNRARRSSEPRKGIYDACGLSWRKPLEYPEAETAAEE